jgi:hypothetical protein
MKAQIHAVIVWDSRFVDLTGLGSQISFFGTEEYKITQRFGSVGIEFF